jgi:outer membrane protein OmpA-like peptidoglycan-associated protein
MRLFWLVAAIATGANPARGDEPGTSPRATEHRELVPLRVQIDASKVDLAGHRLEVRTSREARRVTLKVLGESGAILADVDHDGSGQPSGTVRWVTWAPSSDEPVARIEVFAYDAYGYYAGVAITPWSLSIPHEEVNFKTDSFSIEASEKSKLETSFARIAEALATHRDIGTVTLFIAGHTDSVGKESHNFGLSMQRARAIAVWFRQRGLTLPVAYEGFGESALLIKTADEVDEPKNRRVEYILALGEPNITTNGFRAAWKRLR